ncbi:DUF445 family protein, partial [Candidatus Poribacteria bacterium]|nr:DUF445 family protein [Candidatus Poribacteria bacterium]
MSFLAAGGGAWLVLARLLPGAFPPPGPWSRGAIIILVSGAIGFGTNWLAIKMLFRPRARRDWLVAWPQGLLPREQARFARALGQAAAEHLLNPEAVAAGLNDEHLRGEFGGALRHELEELLAAPGTRKLLTEFVADGLREHGPGFVRSLRPHFRQGLECVLEAHFTSARV